LIYQYLILIVFFIDVWRKGEVCTGCWWGNQRERDHWGDQDVGGRIILRWIFRKWEGVCGLDGGRERCAQGFDEGTRGKETTGEAKA
jgi:hypothetical protein